MAAVPDIDATAQSINRPQYICLLTGEPAHWNFLTNFNNGLTLVEDVRCPDLDFDALTSQLCVDNANAKVKELLLVRTNPIDNFGWPNGILFTPNESNDALPNYDQFSVYWRGDVPGGPNLHITDASVEKFRHRAITFLQSLAVATSNANHAQRVQQLAALYPYCRYFLHNDPSPANRITANERVQMRQAAQNFYRTPVQWNSQLTYGSLFIQLVSLVSYAKKESDALAIAVSQVPTITSNIFHPEGFCTSFLTKFISYCCKVPYLGYAPSQRQMDTFTVQYFLNHFNIPGDGFQKFQPITLFFLIPFIQRCHELTNGYLIDYNTVLQLPGYSGFVKSFCQRNKKWIFDRYFVRLCAGAVPIGEVPLYQRDFHNAPLERYDWLGGQFFPFYYCMCLVCHTVGRQRPRGNYRTNTEFYKCSAENTQLCITHAPTIIEFPGTHYPLKVTKLGQGNHHAGATYLGQPLAQVLQTIQAQVNAAALNPHNPP